MKAIAESRLQFSYVRVRMSLGARDSTNQSHLCTHWIIL